MDANNESLTLCLTQETVGLGLEMVEISHATNNCCFRLSLLLAIPKNDLIPRFNTYLPNSCNNISHKTYQSPVNVPSLEICFFIPTRLHDYQVHEKLRIQIIIRHTNLPKEQGRQYGQQVSSYLYILISIIQVPQIKEKEGEEGHDMLTKKLITQKSTWDNGFSRE